MTAARSSRRNGWLLLAAVVVVASACSGGSSDATAKPDRKPVATTTTAADLPAGTRFDDEGLPRPVSNLVVLDDLVVYYAPAEDADLQLVAVDPELGEVRWARAAALPATWFARMLDPEGFGGAVVAFDREADGGPFQVTAREPDGSTRWSVAIETPIDFPEHCGDRVCIDTRKGPVAIDPDTGAEEQGPEPRGRLLASSADQVLRIETHPDELGGRQIRAVPRFGPAPSWNRPVSELFGAGDFADGYGTVFGDLWVVALEIEVPHDAPYPRTYEMGSMAGFAVQDGAPRWHRPGLSPCLLPVAPDLLVSCGIAAVEPSADADSRLRLTGVRALDPATGADRISVATEQYDIGNGDRLAVAGPDRLAVRTPSGIEFVDLRAATSSPAGERPVAWCRPDGHLPEVRDAEGEPTELDTTWLGRPCVVDGSKADDDELMAPIVDGTLPPAPLASVVQIGRWVLWNDDGHLTGVAVSR